MKYFKNRFLLVLMLFSGLLYSQKKMENTQMNEKEIRAQEDLIEGIRQKNLGLNDKAIFHLQRAIDSSPKLDAAYYELCQVLLDEKNLPKAIEMGEKALELSPKNQWYESLMVNIYLRTGQNEKALKQFEQMLKNNPRNPETIIQYSGVLIQLEKYDQALSLLNNAEKNQISHDMIPMQRLMIFQKKKDIDNAEKELKKMIINNPSDVRYQLALAEFYENNLKKEEALKTYRNVLLIEPNNPQALMNLSAEFLKEKDTLGFLRSSQSIIENKNLDIDTKIGYLSYGLSNYNKLDSSFRRIYSTLSKKLITQYPENAKAFAINGDFYYINNENEEAAQNYKKSLQFQNDIFEVWQNLFSTLFSIKKYQELSDSTRSAMEYYPAMPSVHLYHGLANQYLDNLAEAEKSLIKAARFSGDNERLQAQIYSSLGELYNKQKNYTKMDEAFQRSIKLDPNNAYTLNNYAYYLSLRKSDLENAKRMSRKSLDIEPKNGSFLDTYAWICFQLGQYQEAQLYQEKALEAEKEDKKTIYEHYADILAVQGNTAKALEYWKKSLEAGNDSKTLLKKIKEKKYIESNE